MSTARSEHLTTLGYTSQSASQTRSTSPSAGNSPIEPPLPSSRPPFGLPVGMNPPPGMMAGNSRSGAGSPSHEMGTSSRLFSKRAREIQAQEGVPGLPVSLWGGPPTSGNSTPLRENIPESPTDGFPDFAQLPTPDSLPQTRRARAGTVPSRFSPGGAGNGLLNIPGLAAKSARQTPAQTPFNKSPSPNLEVLENASNNSTLLSRLRAGSLPQRSQFGPIPGTNSPFGPSIFSSSWNPAGIGRERASTLASIASVGSNGPSSPAQSQFSREGGGESDVHMRTLDYLGLAETPQPPRAQLATPYMSNQEFNRLHQSRFRSYSVNNTDKYADEDDYGELTESQYLNLQDQMAATNAAIHNHNLAVQAFTASQVSVATRPRARTAGVLDTPGSRLMRTYGNSSLGVSSTMTPADIRLQEEEDLPQAVAAMDLGRSNSRNAGLLSTDEAGLEGPTCALWLGSIPTSTTTSTLMEMFKPHGHVVSARVLTHKNCGFVNFERIESAISAKASMNGKEIFPGAGPVRINFAKPQSSASNTPGHDGVYPSPSPDPFAKGQEGAPLGGTSTPAGETASAPPAANVTPTVRPLRAMTDDILAIVGSFEASDESKVAINERLQSAIEYNGFKDEIPPIREPTHTRSHDAPKLRDIRKRLDNQSLTDIEVEAIAIDMLPEIAELSSDYLGNTVVQKLFEHCSDNIRDDMLREIAPHLAEIGVHKNGTWAAQKIIDVCKTHSQMGMIVRYLRPYTIPLFLDQYGNYVLQGCLKFGAPYTDFIFESMLSRMWEIAQGRFGARAMRACLESHHATKDQQRMLAAAIALHSVQLATNANGALLLTWFLDTCTFPLRRTVLSPQLVPYLVHLCTHKVAYLTVLKVINQKNEVEARDVILRALFYTPNDQVLEAILNDHSCGATLIFKVITTPFFDDSIRAQVSETIKNVLVRIKAQPNQGYKRLMDEVGLSTRNNGNNRDASTHSEHRQRPSSRQTNANGHHAQSGHSNKPFYNPANTPSNHNQNQNRFDLGYNGQRNENVNLDTGVSSFPQFNQNMMYNAPNAPMAAATMQQIQYQQSMMGRGAPMGYNFAQMPAGYNTYGADQFRQQNMPNGSPVQPPAHMPPMPSGPTPYPPGFGMGMGYGYNMNMGYMQQDQSNPRRGRR